MILREEERESEWVRVYNLERLSNGNGYGCKFFSLPNKKKCMKEQEREKLPLRLMK